METEAKIENREDAAAIDDDDGDDDGGGTRATSPPNKAREGEEAQNLKLCVSGFTKYMKIKQIEKFFEGKVEYDGIKRPPNTSVAILRFKDVVSRDAARSKLNKGLVCKGKQIRASIARSGDRAFDNGEGGGGGGKRQKGGAENGGGNQGQPRTLSQAVTPLLHLPYEVQLRRKQEDMQNLCIDKMFKEIKNFYYTRNRQQKQNQHEQHELPLWLLAGSKDFPLAEIRPSPATSAYRNKCEFTIGRNGAGEPTVGFRQSTFQMGANIVAGPQECIHIDDQSKKVAAALQAYIRSSALVTYDLMTHTGCWRFLTVRSSQRTGQCLIMLCVSLTKGLQEGQWESEQKKLLAYLTAPTEPSLPFELPSPSEEDQPLPTPEAKTWTGITSIYLQPYEGLSNPNAETPITHLWGRQHIEESLFGLTFRISPTAFFQTNTAGAEVLYSQVIDSLSWIKEEGQQQAEESAVLDVCCGTGTIGICTAKKTKAKTVLGIEMCKGAFDDARVNAQVNGIENAAFVCSKAEDILVGALRHGNWRYDNQATKDDQVSQHLQEILSKGSQSLLAIVDPPRDGMHPDCLKAIRNCRKIKRLVYVSCNPTKSLVRDSVTLCGPTSKNLTEEAFRPVSAVPVDMFPHTIHCELVMVFERGTGSTGTTTITFTTTTTVDVKEEKVCTGEELDAAGN